MRGLTLWRAKLAVAAALGLYCVPAPTAPFSPMDFGEFKTIVRSSASSDRQLAPVYARQEFGPIWFSGSNLSPAGETLLDLLRSADLDGLDPGDYGVERIDRLIAEGGTASPRDLARADVLMSRALIRYARDLHRPAKIGMTYVDKELVPRAPAPRDVLEAAAMDLPLERATQMHPLYSQLRAGYATWRANWSHLPEIPVASGSALAAGAKGQRVRDLRLRLGLPDGSVFDKEVGAAVRRYKRAFGLQATPVADAATLALLNQPLRQQEARIRINMARARQLPLPSTGRHVVVDAAAQRLWVFDGAQLRDTMKVVVGKPSEPTPMLAGLIRYAALNPYWNVPPDLVKDRVAANVLTEGLGYLHAKGYEVLSDWTEDARPVDPATVDWNAAASGKIELPVRQLPGPANMMGAMKFMFPNELGVYLHDTPDKNLFGDADRRKSSGCVRLEEARRLAKWLFGTVPVVPPTAREQHVPLAKPVPVYITYLTVGAEGSGLSFHDDAYGRDQNRKLRHASLD